VNPAHDPRSPLYNPGKTPLPADALSVYQNSVRGSNTSTWYGLNSSGQYYRYFYNNAGSVHFSGVIPKAQIPNDVLKQLGQ
jgi:filamentous hemagglutinin